MPKKKNPQYSPGISGRPRSNPESIRFNLMRAFWTIEKQGKLDMVNKAELVKRVNMAFPKSKFNIDHATWYLNAYKRWKEIQHPWLIRIMAQIHKKPRMNTQGLVLK